MDITLRRPLGTLNCHDQTFRKKKGEEKKTVKEKKKSNNETRRKPDRPLRWSRLCGCLQNRRHISNTRKTTSQSRSVLGQQYSNLGLGDV